MNAALAVNDQTILADFPDEALWVYCSLDLLALNLESEAVVE
jgi:hypothetical protein